MGAHDENLVYIHLRFYDFPPYQLFQHFLNLGAPMNSDALDILGRPLTSIAMGRLAVPLASIGMGWATDDDPVSHSVDHGE